MIISGQNRHALLCSDTAAQRLVFVDSEGNVTKEIPNVSACYDVWYLPDDQILYTQNSSLDVAGITRIDKDGNVLFHYLSGKELFSCQPLENGHYLLGLLGEPQLREIDAKGNTVMEIALPYEGKPHDGMRWARKYGDFYYVLQPGICKIRKLSQSGAIVNEYDIHPDAFGLLMLPNGHILYTCMSGAYELDASGAEVWTLTDQDVPNMQIRWLLGVQLLSNGNLVFTNWMGHGHRDEGIHFFEVTHQKEVVWSLDSRQTLWMPSVSQILDEDPYKVCYTPLK